MSTIVWYGVFPLPLHKPQTRVSVAPVPVHGVGVASFWPALTDDASGASANT